MTKCESIIIHTLIETAATSRTLVFKRSLRRHSHTPTMRPLRLSRKIIKKKTVAQPSAFDVIFVINNPKKVSANGKSVRHIQ